MGWNSGYTTMEATVIAIYNTGNLTAELLDEIMTPYKGTGCDSGGSHDLRSNDGLGVKEIICKTMKPAEYKEAMDNPRMYEDFEEYKDAYIWKVQIGSSMQMKRLWKYSTLFGEICGEFGK